MTKNFKLEHSISREELEIYNIIVTSLSFNNHFISLTDIKENLEDISTNKLLCLLNQLKERVIIIYDNKKNMEISTTLFKFDFIFVRQTEVYLNFEVVELFDVEFKHYLGKFRSNQAYRSYESLNGRFSYYEDKIKQINCDVVTDDFATNLIKETNTTKLNKLDNKAKYDKKYYEEKA